MTAKEYLSQAYRLDQRIDSNIAEITRLREMACGISSPSWEEKVQTSRNTDAPFVRCLEKIMDLEKVVNRGYRRQCQRAHGSPLPLHPQHDMGADRRRVERRRKYHPQMAQGSSFGSGFTHRPDSDLKDAGNTRLCR